MLNMCIVVGGVSLVSISAVKFTPPTTKQYMSDWLRSVHRWQRFELRDVDLARRDWMIVLAIDERCPACAANAGFYRRLTELRRPSVATIALSRHPIDQFREFLGRERIQPDGVKQVEWDRLSITILPTLLIVDRNGRVQWIWRGALDVSSQEEVVRIVEAL